MARNTSRRTPAPNIRPSVQRQRPHPPGVKAFTTTNEPWICVHRVTDADVVHALSCGKLAGLLQGCRSNKQLLHGTLPQGHCHTGTLTVPRRLLSMMSIISMNIHHGKSHSQFLISALSYCDQGLRCQVAGISLAPTAPPPTCVTTSGLSAHLHAWRPCYLCELACQTPQSGASCTALPCLSLISPCPAHHFAHIIPRIIPHGHPTSRQPRRGRSCRWRGSPCACRCSGPSVMQLLLAVTASG